MKFNINELEFNKLIVHYKNTLTMGKMDKIYTQVQDGAKNMYKSKNKEYLWTAIFQDIGGMLH